MFIYKGMPIYFVSGKIPLETTVYTAVKLMHYTLYTYIYCTYTPHV